MKSKFLFYLLSFTWGLPMTLIGCVAAIFLFVTGHEPMRWGYCYHFKIGEHWGGLNLGVVFITDKTPSIHTMNHEYGHGIQNCYFGLLMPFIVCIPSVVRYWYREYLVRSGKNQYSELPDYDAVWFESQASNIGTKFINWYNTKNN